MLLRLVPRFCSVSHSVSLGLLLSLARSPMSLSSTMSLNLSTPAQPNVTRSHVTLSPTSLGSTTSLDLPMSLCPMSLCPMLLRPPCHLPTPLLNQHTPNPSRIEQMQTLPTHDSHTCPWFVYMYIHGGFSFVFFVFFSFLLAIHFPYLAYQAAYLLRPYS